MPTPNSPGVIKAQAILQGRSGLPEDRFVTTFHFRTATAASADPLHMAAARDKVKNFFTQPLPNSGPTLTDSLSGAVTRGPTALEIRCYHLGDPEDRIPVITKHEILGTPNAAASLPAELAICLSFSGENPSLPRQRGRIYFGPLLTNAITVDTTTGRARVSNTLQGTLRDLGQRMMGEQNDSEPARWVVYSPTSNTSTLVRRGYVDDAFDIQRRRGEATVLRTGWTGP